MDKIREVSEVRDELDAKLIGLVDSPSPVNDIVAVHVAELLCELNESLAALWLADEWAVISRADRFRLWTAVVCGRYHARRIDRARASRVEIAGRLKPTLERLRGGLTSQQEVPTDG